MDPRIQQRILELRQEQEQKKLWNARINSSVSKLKLFLQENEEGVAEIFKLSRATFLKFYVDQSKERLLCYCPSMGFHVRCFPKRFSAPEEPVTHEVEFKFDNLKALVSDFAERSRNPEQLVDIFAEAILLERCHIDDSE